MGGQSDGWQWRFPVGGAVDHGRVSETDPGLAVPTAGTT
jgi:hypothetical protein